MPFHYEGNSMHNRRLIGACAAVLSVAALAVGVQTLIPGLRLAHADHSPTLAIDRILSAVPLILIAAGLAKLAFRNLFWERYIASVRRTMGITTAPPNER